MSTNKQFLLSVCGSSRTISPLSVRKHSGARWRIIFNILLILVLCTKSSVCFRSQRFQARRERTRITTRDSTHESFLTRARKTADVKTSARDTALHAASKSGAKLVLTPEDFGSSVLQSSSNRPVMVFYTAPWCGPCRLVTPVVKDVMKLYANQMDAVEVCTDDLPEVCAESGVVSIPTIQMYFRGKLLDTIVGCVAKSVLCSAVEKVVEDAVAAQKKLNKQGGRDDFVNGDPLQQDLD